MLEELLPRWRGKAFVLVLLGFAATDFVITITLSAADVTEHIIHNPFVPGAFDHPVGCHAASARGVGRRVLEGLSEAIGLAVAIVAVYLALNVVVIGWGLLQIAQHADYFPRWTNALVAQHGSIWSMLGIGLILFPKLALELSGFETGVAVMPLVEGVPAMIRRAGGQDPQHQEAAARRCPDHERAAGRQLDRDDFLIPPEAFRDGGPAAGRALAYLAHEHLGVLFGTVYSISDDRDSLVCWIVGDGGPAQPGPSLRAPVRDGAGVDAGRATTGGAVYGDRFPDHDHLQGRRRSQRWGVCNGRSGSHDIGGCSGDAGEPRAARIVPWFRARVSGVRIHDREDVIERPDGVGIAAWFIGAIIASSLVSRVMRSTELRIERVDADATVRQFLDDSMTGPVRIHREPARKRDVAEYDKKFRDAQESHHLGPHERVLISRSSRAMRRNSPTS